MAESVVTIDKPSLDGRTSGGKFTKGHRISVGNKGNRTMTRAKELHRVLYNAVGTASLKKIIEKMIEQAKKGDKDARKECFDRLWGKAQQNLVIGGNQELPPIRLEIVRDDRPAAITVDSEVID